MLINSFSDFNSVFISLLSGAILELIYSIFSSLRCVFKFKKSSIFIQDIIFSIIASLLTFLILLVRVKGEIRWFIIFFELLGFIFTRCLISKHFKILIIKIILLINTYIFKPIKFINNTIIDKLNKLFDKFLSKFSKKT